MCDHFVLCLSPPQCPGGGRHGGVRGRAGGAGRPARGAGALGDHLGDQYHQQHRQGGGEL